MFFLYEQDALLQIMSFNHISRHTSSTFRVPLFSNTEYLPLNESVMSIS